MKALNDLRQCDVFDNSILKKLQNLSPVNLNVVLSEESFCVIVTQDCDIVHKKIEEEPFLEFIIHNRFFVKKDSLDKFEFSDVLFELTSDNKKILKKWLGSRYTRAAFPDEFNIRLEKSKFSKLIEKGVSSKVSHIFF